MCAWCAGRVGVRSAVRDIHEGIVVVHAGELFGEDCVDLSGGHAVLCVGCVVQHMGVWCVTMVWVVRRGVA